MEIASGANKITKQSHLYYNVKSNSRKGKSKVIGIVYDAFDVFDIFGSCLKTNRKTYVHALSICSVSVSRNTPNEDNKDYGQNGFFSHLSTPCLVAYSIMKELKNRPLTIVVCYAHFRPLDATLGS